MTGTLQKILRNTVALTAARGIDAVVIVLMAAAISRYLGPEIYGEYGFVMSLVAFLMSLTYFGIERIAIRNIARDREGAEAILGTALVTRWILSAIAVIILLVILVAVDLESRLRIAILLTTVSHLALSATAPYSSVFKAYERMEYETLLAFVFQSLALLLIVLVVGLDLGFIAVFAALATANIGRFVAAVAISSRKFIKPKVTFDTAAIKAFLKDSFVLGMNLVVIQALLRIDVLLLKAMKGNMDVSLYFAPHSLLVRLQILPVAFSTALFPFFSRSAQNDRDSLSYGFEKAFTIMAMASAALVVVGMFWASDIITLIFGKAFIDATLTLQILMPAAVFLSLHPLLGFVLIANDKQSLLLPASIGALLLNLVLDLMLIPRYGSMGAGAASLVGYACLFALTLYFVDKHVIKMPLGRIALKPAGAMALAIIVAYFLKG